MFDTCRLFPPVGDPQPSCMLPSHHLLFGHFLFVLIVGPNIPVSHAILFIVASDFTSITSHIHNWVLFLLWLSLLILSPLFSSSTLGSYWPGEFIFQCHILLPFHTVHGVLKARILKWFSIPISSWPYFVRTLHHDPSSVALHDMVHCFTELDKALSQGINLVSFL